MLDVITTTKFEKDFGKARKQHRDLTVLKNIMRQLAEEKKLDPKYLDHPLKGKWVGCRECHVENDWLLIYRVLKKENLIYFERLGTHSELFK